jgi:hypothetical protein
MERERWANNPEGTPQFFAYPQSLLVFCFAYKSILS